MPEEVIFERELQQSRAEIATYLRTVADRLETGDALTLSGGGDSVTLEPPADLTFEVKAERETGSGDDELSVEFELEWRDGDETEADAGGLDIS